MYRRNREAVGLVTTKEKEAARSDAGEQLELQRWRSLWLGRALEIINPKDGWRPPDRNKLDPTLGSTCLNLALLRGARNNPLPRRLAACSLQVFAPTFH